MSYFVDDSFLNIITKYNNFNIAMLNLGTMMVFIEFDFSFSRMFIIDVCKNISKISN